ncbi:MAG: hypothetical protein ACREQL_09825 [Candidatus Binatia bacterium]
MRQSRLGFQAFRITLVAIALACRAPDASATGRTGDEPGSALLRVRSAILAIRDASPGEVGFGEESARVLRLYAEAWRRIGDWASRYLRGHPGARADELAAALAGLTPPDARACLSEAYREEMRWDFPEGKGYVEPKLEAYPLFPWCFAVQVRALALGRGMERAFAVVVTFGERGTLLVLSRAGVAASGEVLPLGSGGEIRALPNDRVGRRRFYVHTRPADDFPLFSVGCQELTIWRWDGHHLARLFWENYSTYKGQRIAYDGTALTTRTKGRIRSFFTSNQDDRLDATKRIAVERDAIRDEGLRYDNPELAVIDELFQRLMIGADVAAIAAPEVVAVLDPIVGGLTCTGGCALGWLEQSRIDRSAASTFIDVAFEEIPGRLQLTMIARGRTLYVTSALYAR